MIPKPKFPFIISSFEKELVAGNALKPLKKILAQNEENREQISKLLTKIGFLESAFDEFLEKEKDESTIEDFFKKIVPVLDNLDSLKRAIIDSGEEGWKKGIDFFYEKFFSLLSQYNLEITAKKGMMFDPAMHEAVGVENNANLPEGTIVSVIENGWIYNNKVLRFAKIILSKEN